MASNAVGLIIRSQYLGEPNLVFADAREHVDPKLGISRFGPKSYSPRRRHPVTVRVGFIGTADTMAATGDWIKKGAEGVPGDAKHPEFPRITPPKSHGISLLASISRPEDFLGGRLG